jgi:predicted MFS family arabinose efflux permease/HAMP domain-containing protein
MKHALQMAPIRQLFAFALLLLLISQAILSVYAWSIIEDKIRPELDRKAATVGTSIANKIVQALDHGIPFDRLQGVDEFFDEVLKENQDLSFLIVAGADGRVHYSSGVNNEQAASVSAQIGSRSPSPGMRTVPVQAIGEQADRKLRKYFSTSVPIQQQERTVGVLYVGVDQSFVLSQVSDLRYDIGIILLTSMLVAFEVLLFIISLNFFGPIRQVAELMTRIASGDFSHRATVVAKESLGTLAERLNQLVARVNQAFVDVGRMATQNVQVSAVTVVAQLRARYVFAENGAVHDLAQQRIVAVRILTFLFMFAEMLSRPFLPLYVGTLPDPGFGLSPDFIASLPITANLLGVACSMPFAGRWSDRMGRRRSYMLGAAIIAIGLLASGMAPSFVVLLLARTLTGIGYALMFMSCQGYVIDNTDDNNRGQGIALFVGAIMVSEICAPAIGGILADRIGYRLVFIFGAIVTMVAAVLAIRLLDDKGARKQSSQPGGKRLVAGLTRNYRFMAISILAGIPAKLLLSGFLIYLVPMILAGFGGSKSEIGRYAMVYGVIALALTPFFARLADRYHAHTLMVGAGGLLTGIGLLPILLDASSANVLFGIAALGLGQSMSISAQLVLVTRVTREEAQIAGTATVLGVFRLIERLGGAVGPAIAGALVSIYGTANAMGVLGVFGVVSSILFMLVLSMTGAGSDEERQRNLAPKGVRT